MRRDIEADHDWVRLAIPTKVADRLSNVRASERAKSRHLEMDRQEWGIFHQTLWVPGLCDSMWEDLERRLGR